MNDSRASADESAGGGEVLDLAKAGDRARQARKDRAAAELATRFHRAMGWKGKPDAPGGKPGKKSKSKKKR